MKNITQVLLVIVFLILVVIGKTNAQETITPDAFDEIYVTGNIEVKLEKGEENKVELYVDGMPYDKVSVKVQRGVLKLRVLESWMYRDEIIRVYITYKDLRGIRANAGAIVESESLIEADEFIVKATSGAQVELSIEANKIEGGASEGGILELEGSAETQDMQVSTGGQYDGLLLDVNTTYIRSNTGGQAEVVAMDLLEAYANTGGSIVYKGDPKKKNVKTVIAGEVRRY
ncbi:MAG: hypothetical protein Sapg2KO_52070 [Saprospiraceae bacterium]